MTKWKNNATILKCEKSLFLRINPATWETQTQIIVDVMQSHSQRTSKNDKKGLSLEKLLQIAFHPPRHFKFENILIIIMSHISTSTISKIIITVLFWLYAKIQPSLSLSSWSWKNLIFLLWLLTICYPFSCVIHLMINYSPASMHTIFSLVYTWPHG